MNAHVPELTGISHLDMTVTDVERSERFYTEVLGFRGVERVDKEGFRFAVMRHSGLPHELCVGCPAANDVRIVTSIPACPQHAATVEASERELSARAAA